MHQETAHFRLCLDLWGDAQPTYLNFGTAIYDTGLLRLPAPVCVFLGNDMSGNPFVLTVNADGGVNLAVHVGGEWLTMPAENAQWLGLIIAGVMLTQGVAFREASDFTTVEMASAAPGMLRIGRVERLADGKLDIAFPRWIEAPSPRLS